MKLFSVSHRQVCSSNAAVKQYISAYQKSLFFAVKANTSGRMARGMNDLQFVLPQLYLVALIQIVHFALVVVKRHLVHKPRRGRKLQYYFFFGMYIEIQTVGFSDKLISKHVV